jgi:DNA-binding MarR family transcriptional regulator
LQKYCDVVLKPYGISKMQWLIIGTVLDAGPGGVRITDLAERLGTTMPYMTTSVKLLELKGMLVRTGDKRDSRAKLVTVDRRFVPQCEVIERTLRDSLRRTIYRDVDPAEFRIYLKVLFQLSRLGI